MCEEAFEHLSANSVDYVRTVSSSARPILHHGSLSSIEMECVSEERNSGGVKLFTVASSSGQDSD